MKWKHLISGMLFSSAFYASAQTPAEVFDIRRYGAKGDGITSDTRALNAAIAASREQGGGTIYVPPGAFVTGSVRLYSHTHLYLAPGAVLLASADSGDFLLQKDYGFTGYGAGNRLGLIFAVHAEDVSVTGPGTIDGRPEFSLYMDSVQQEGPGDDAVYTRQGRSYMDPAWDKSEAPVMWKGLYQDRPGPLIVFDSCTKAVLSGFTIADASDWSIALIGCEDTKVTGLSIRNNPSVPNSDGIDLYDCHDALISDCDIHAGDDAIAVISSTNLSVTNCTLQSRSAGIRIGYNVFNHRNSGNLLFDNIRIYDANRGIGIFQRQPGDMENMIFSNMVIDTRLYPGQWWGHGEPIHISTIPALGNIRSGAIRHVFFSHIIARGEEGILLYGSASSPLEDIRFDQVRLTIAPGPMTPHTGGNFDLRPAAGAAAGLFRHDIPAIYAQYTDGLSLRQVDVHWEGSPPAFFTNALACVHFHDLVLDGFTGVSARAGLPAVHLEEGVGVRKR
jgi:polygalacturonase